MGFEDVTEKCRGQTSKSVCHSTLPVRGENAKWLKASCVWMDGKLLH